jgi:hypothetical protein
MTTPPAPRTVFEVRRWDGKWIVHRQDRPAGEYDAFETQNEALARARQLADAEPQSLVKIIDPTS